MPVKNEQTTRKEWFERKDIDQRVKDLRNAVWQEYGARIDGLWWNQQQAWKAAIQQTKARDRAIRADVRAKYKHTWRNLQQLKGQRISGNVFERAVYVFTHRRRRNEGRDFGREL